MESSSELSELASSVFNGIEGIELGGGTTISQGWEDEEIGGVIHIEIGDGGVPSGDSEVQAPIFSPRKTRSGRVIK